MPKIHECDQCFLYARNPHLICAVHPTGPNTNTCIDFRENPDAEPDELWEPEGATYYNGELILQPRQRWTRLATVIAAGYPPTIYWIEALDNHTVRTEALEYLDDVVTEIQSSTPKQSRLKASLTSLWNVVKDIVVVANAVTALAERLGFP